MLEKEADLSGDELNYSRSLAFRRCIAVLKAYPSEIKRLSEIKKLPHVGGHCQKVIKVNSHMSYTACLWVLLWLSIILLQLFYYPLWFLILRPTIDETIQKMSFSAFIEHGKYVPALPYR